ncbi:hypothetical protein G6027_06325 [Dietzia sp. SLG310A2-38A2]|nr:hypothetical protein [Dietzia sp. SLG310A2-38A2]
MSGVGQLLSMCVDYRLDGAACKGRHELFDPCSRDEHRDDFNYRSAAARRVCGTCPVRARCSEVAEGLVVRHRQGTWAGVTYGAFGQIVGGGGPSV